MRIAFVTETFLPKTDGIVTTLCQTIAHLQRGGDQVMVIAPEGGIREYRGAAVHGVPAFPFPLYPELKLAIPRPAIGAVLRAFQPDLIHVANPAFLGTAAFYYSKTLRIPLVTSYHTDTPAYLRSYRLGWLEGAAWKVLRASHNRTRLNLCTSDVVRRQLMDHGIERVAVWPGGVDLDTFHIQSACQQTRAALSGGKPNGPLLLYVGRLSKEKGIEQLRPILQAIPEARLALVGDGPYRRQLERHFAGTATYFAGYLHGKSLASAFASADVFVLPSRTETLGLVLLEAMAAGCPVVAARAGGIPNAVQDGVTGLLYDPDDERSAILAIQQLLRDPQQQALLRQNGCAEAGRRSWAAATETLRGYYLKVLAGEPQS